MTELADIADLADELTNPIRKPERIWEDNGHGHRRLRRLYVVTLPSLLDQLAAAVVPGESYAEGDEQVRGAFQSRPAARIDAIDRYLAIEVGAVRWCLYVALRARETPSSNIRALVGAAGTMTSDQRDQLHSDLRRWRTWAATVTGWERPPDAPRGAPCPACDRRNTLRVRLDRETACCLACGAGWDQATIGILADHIRTYGERSGVDTDALRTEAVHTRRATERYDATRPDLPYVS